MTSASIPMDEVVSPSSQEHHASQTLPSSSPHPPSPTMPRTPTSVSTPDRHSLTHVSRDEPQFDQQQSGEEHRDANDSAAVIDIAGETTLHHEGHEVEGDDDPTTKLENRKSGLPSPPLTIESGHQDDGDDAEEEEAGDAAREEMDVADWHPLGHTRTDSRDLNQTQDATLIENGGANGSLSQLADEEKEPVSPMPHFRVDLKPPSPQPWDLVDPPPSNGHANDYYSTIGTKNLNSLAKKSRPPIPRSSYYVGPPPVDSAYGTPPIGHIGVHHPREILRIERDYTGGELVQFAPSYPLELEGRITPTQFLETINLINELLISAHSVRYSTFHNALAILTLQLSTLVFTSHYEKEMGRLEQVIEQLNVELYNPAGLNILWPRKVAFLFLEIEYY